MFVESKFVRHCSMLTLKKFPIFFSLLLVYSSGLYRVYSLLRECQVPRGDSFLMPAVPKFVLNELASARLVERSSTLTSSSWFDDIVLRLVFTTERARTVNRIDHSTDFRNIASMFQAGWHQLSCRIDTMPPSKRLLDLFLTQWTSVLPLLIRFVATSAIQEDVAFEELIASQLLLVELLAESVMTVARRAEALSSTVGTFMAATNSVSVDPSVEFLRRAFLETSRGLMSKTWLDREASILVPPMHYLLAIHRAIVCSRFACLKLCITQQQRGGGTEDDDLCRLLADLQNDFRSVCHQHAVDMMRQVILPSLYSENWTSAARYFSGRAASHSITFFFGHVVSRMCPFLTAASSLSLSEEDVATRFDVAQNVLRVNVMAFLDAYFLFVQHLKASVEVSTVRIAQLCCDVMYIVRCCRWMELLFNASDRVEVSTRALQILACSCSMYHVNSHADADMEPELQQQVTHFDPHFLALVWNVTPLRGWSDVVANTTTPWRLGPCCSEDSLMYIPHTDMASIPVPQITASLKKLPGAWESLPETLAALLPPS